MSASPIGSRGYYAPVVHAAALLTFLGWWLIGGMAWQPALTDRHQPC